MTDAVGIVIEYINEAVQKSDIMGLSVCRTSDFENSVGFPLITVEDIGNSEITTFSPLYETEVLSSCGLQFNVFANAMSINDKIYSAKEVCRAIVNLIDKLMHALPSKNTDIKSCVRSGTQEPMPIDTDMTSFRGVIRFTCTAKYN